MLPVVKLPITFDTERLKQDLAGLKESAYVEHFNKQQFSGDWSVLPLRSIGGLATHIYPDPTKTGSYADTVYLAQCPYFQEIIRGFGTAVESARLLRLGAGSIITEHRDYKLGFEDGEIRLHIPIVTHPDVDIFLNKERVEMHEGECWYLNFNLPHALNNRSPIDRVHLVIDCLVDAHIRDSFPAEWVESAATS
jgi:hypothetical protein